MALRGAEAPLFHGAAHVFEFFRNLFSNAVGGARVGRLSPPRLTMTSPSG